MRHYASVYSVLAVPHLMPVETAHVLRCSVLSSRLSADVASLAWDPPADDREAPVTGYEYRYFGPCASEPQDACVCDVRTVRSTSVTVTGLNAGGSYDFQVRAVNAVGAGEWTVPFNTVLCPQARGEIIVSPSSVTVAEGGESTFPGEAEHQPNPAGAGHVLQLGRRRRPDRDAAGTAGQDTAPVELAAAAARGRMVRVGVPVERGHPHHPGSRRRRRHRERTGDHSMRHLDRAQATNYLAHRAAGRRTRYTTEWPAPPSPPANETTTSPDF